MELAFATQEDVFEVNERVYTRFSEFSDKQIDETPFQRIPYLEAMDKYGSDNGHAIHL